MCNALCHNMSSVEASQSISSYKHRVDKLHDALQDVGKKHGLDDLEKIKEEGILEQVITHPLCLACKTTMVAKAAVLLSS